MAWLRISDKAAEGFLAFDPRDVLRALGPDAPGWTWTVSAVEETGEELWATGEGVGDLEALERSGEPVAGSRLIRIADRVQQVIWGEFRAHRHHDPTSTEPFVRVVASTARISRSGATMTRSSTACGRRSKTRS